MPQNGEGEAFRPHLPLPDPECLCLLNRRGFPYAYWAAGGLSVLSNSSRFSPFQTIAECIRS
jgi:hypothetical protein